MKKFQIFFLCAFLMCGFQSCEDFLEDEFDCEELEDCECPHDEWEYDNWEYDQYDSLDSAMDSDFYDDIAQVELLDDGTYIIAPFPELMENEDWNAEILVAPENGEIQAIDDMNAFIYTPNADFSGFELITFIYTNENGEEVEITIEINVDSTEEAAD